MKNNLSKLTWISITCLIVSCSSCKDDPEEPKPMCVAGKGGAVTFVLQPEHHGEAIPSTDSYRDSAWIKFNTSNYQGDNPAAYDLIVVGDTGTFEVIVDSMTCGNYFIYMTGFDASIAERVRGGIPVTITEQSGVKTIKIPVTED